MRLILVFAILLIGLPAWAPVNLAGKYTLAGRFNFPPAAVPPAANDVAFDAVTESSTFTTADPFTFDHTPVGVPKGVLVFIDHGTEGTDLIDGAVTCDGIAMTRVRDAFDTSSEPGGVYAYFLGTGIPNETLTIS